MQCLLLALAVAVMGQAPPDAAFPAHRVVGNTYYVGSKALATYLVATPEGHILINSGFEETVPLIRASVESLGFKMRDVKIILESHAHSDHVAGHALLKELTSAKVYVMRGDDKVIASGGEGQYLYTDSRWKPCAVDVVLKDGDEVKLGGATLMARLTPGHTRGCTTWTWRVADGDKKYDVVVIGSPNVNPGYRLVDNMDYPEIADDFAKTFKVLKSLPCDIFLGAHGAYYDMIAKYERVKGAKQNPFIDPAGYRDYVELKEKEFRKTLAEQSTNDNAAEQLASIGRVGPQGAGSAVARKARDGLAKRDIAILPQLLAAMDTPNAVAANWYRTIYEEIVARAFSRSGTAWPLEFLKDFVGDKRHAGRARGLALGLLDRLDPDFRKQWLPQQLDDPEFGYEAISLALAAADKALREKNQDLAKSEFRKAFENARDSGQVTQAANQLKALGESADVAAHLGLVVDWWLVGPFDAPEKTGFATAFEPETKVDLKVTYKGQSGEIHWTRYTSSDPLGQVDLNKALGPTSAAVGYAYAEIDVPRAQEAQLRCGADDNCSAWLNGRKVFAREQWLNGTRFDRFITPIKLTAGRNTLLVKVCQGPQHKDPEVPNNWTVQLRLCDDRGRGVEFENVSRK